MPRRQRLQVHVHVQLCSILTSAPMRVSGSYTPHPGRFIPKNMPSIHSKVGWMGPRASLEGYGNENNLFSHRSSNTGSSSPWRVAIPTTLFRLLVICVWPVIFMTEFIHTPKQQINDVSKEVPANRNISARYRFSDVPLSTYSNY